MERPGLKRFILFSGSANPELAEEVSKLLDVELGAVERSRFADGEIYIRFEDSVRGADCFVIQSHSSPINEHIMEQLIMIDALKRASAKRITAVMPFYGYEYMKVSLTVRGDMCKFDGLRDNIRMAVVESFIDTHGIDCLNIEYGRHDYSWNISDKRKRDMEDAFYSSMFYRDCKHLIKEPLDFFSVKPAHWYYDSYLWGFMTCYDKIMTK